MGGNAWACRVIWVGAGLKTKHCELIVCGCYFVDECVFVFIMVLIMVDGFRLMILWQTYPTKPV